MSFLRLGKAPSVLLVQSVPSLLFTVLDSLSHPVLSSTRVWPFSVPDMVWLLWASSQPCRGHGSVGFVYTTVSCAHFQSLSPTSPSAASCPTEQDTSMSSLTGVSSLCGTATVIPAGTEHAWPGHPGRTRMEPWAGLCSLQVRPGAVLHPL